METQQGFFITFHGLEGSGKTTQAHLLAQSLQGAGLDVLLTREPGSHDPVCQEIRKLLLDPSHKERFSFRAELLLFLADRAQHLDHVIFPAIKEGKIVLSDRHEADTFAYQCIARRVCTVEEFLNLATIVRRETKPHLSFYIDIEPKHGLERNRNAGKIDRLELESLDFHAAVRDGFEYYFANLHGPNWCRIDGMAPQEEVFQNILQHAREKIPGFHQSLESATMT